MQARRVFGDAAVFDNGVCAGTMESSSGNASDALTPRRTVRREICFLVINMLSPISQAKACATIAYPAYVNTSMTFSLRRHRLNLFNSPHLKRRALHNTQNER